MSAVYKTGKGIEIFTVGKGVKIINIQLSVDKVSDFCCCQPKEVPLIWVDNKSLLTQRENGELVIVDLDEKITSFARMAKEKEFCGTSFKKDAEGNLLYSYNHKFIADLNALTIKPQVFEKLGNGFTSKFENYGTDNREIYSFYFNERKIGDFPSENIKSTSGNIAVEFRRAGEDNVYPVGIKIWNDIKKDWITFELDWLPTVIGWIE